MNTLGWLLILLAGLLVRQIAVGRADSLDDDFRDAFVALVTFDSNAMVDVAKRRGESGSPVKSDGAASVPESGSGAVSPGSTVLLAEARKIGGRARGYRWGATGPEFYDCSGLVWRAMKNLGYDIGPRFNTASFPMTARLIMDKVDSPTVGDVALWPGHMGIVSGSDMFYSALSQNSGVKDMKISTMTREKGAAPSYWRMKGASNG